MMATDDPRKVVDMMNRYLYADTGPPPSFRFRLRLWWFVRWGRVRDAWEVLRGRAVIDQ